MRSIVDCYNNKIYFIGPGDVKIDMPPGSTCYDLELSPSGHLMLPITEYDKRDYQGNKTLRRHFHTDDDVGPPSNAP